MLDNMLVIIMFFTIALIGAIVPFVAVSVVKHIRKINARLEEYGARLQEYDEKYNKLLLRFEKMRQHNEKPVSLVQEMEKKSRRLTERLEQLELRGQSQRQYDQAIRLVKRGSTIEEIMTVCGLNRGEAELIRVMHEMDQDLDSLGSAV